MLATPLPRGIVGCAPGLALGTIGLDPVHGTPRCAFGLAELASGLNLTAVLIGFLCMPQVLVLARQPPRFGHGSPSGLLAAEASVSATVGGSLIPLPALDIPGSGAAAMLIGALTLHGLRSGPPLFVERGDIVYGFLGGLFEENLVVCMITVTRLPALLARPIAVGLFLMTVAVAGWTVWRRLARRRG